MKLSEFSSSFSNGHKKMNKKIGLDDYKVNIMYNFIYRLFFVCNVNLEIRPMYNYFFFNLNI